MVDKLIQEMKMRMEKSIHVLEDDLVRVHTGRANPALIEDVKVSYYSTPTPLKFVANIAAPDPNQLIIRPYDPSQKEAIERGILEANLGLNPAVEEDLIRIKVPKLSSERREELVKIIREKGEEAKVSIRNIRRDVKEDLEKLEKKGEITEDDLYQSRDEMDETTHDYAAKIDELIANKEQQLRTI